MDSLITGILRLLHIGGGIFWIGAIWMLTFFVEPTAKALAPDGPKFMQKLMQGQLTIWMSVGAGVNVLAGILLYLRDVGVFGGWGAWLSNKFGLMLTFGAVVALIAFALGIIVGRGTSVKMGALGAQIQAGGKPPTPEQVAELQRLQKQLSSSTRWVAILQAVALVAMELARYI